MKRVSSLLAQGSDRLVMLVYFVMTVGGGWGCRRGSSSGLQTEGRWGRVKTKRTQF